MKTTSFATKVLSGEIPTAEEWVIHLQQAHLEAPSMTPHMLNNYYSGDGKTSYQLLAEAVPVKNDQTLLDLACGDGHLMPMLLQRIGKDGHVIGADMSEGELAVARKNITDKRVRLVQTLTQDMPFNNSSIDHAVCHMAFMLMQPIEPVISELARVLKSGGTFTVMVPSRQPANGLYVEVRKVMWDYLDARWPRMLQAPSGDGRTYTEEGYSELFNESTGFEAKPVHDEHFELECKTGVSDVWEFMKDMYFIGLLPPKEMEELKEQLLATGRKAMDKNRQITMTWQMRMVTLRKA